MSIRAAAIFLLFSVLALLFVPAGAGPFSAVHGPVTALRANRAARVFYSNIEMPAYELVAASRAMPPRADLAVAITFEIDPAALAPLALLRC